LGEGAQIARDALDRPQIGKAERERVERLTVHDDVATPHARDTVSWAVEAQYFEGLEGRVDEPYVADLLSRVGRRLHRPVCRRGGRGQDFTDPVGRELESVRSRQGGHSFATPTRDVRNEHVAAEVELGLVQDNPSARAASSAVKGRVQLAGKG
jgi:hypothetical protein